LDTCSSRRLITPPLATQLKVSKFQKKWQVVDSDLHRNDNFLAKENWCEIIVVNQDSLSPQQEMVEDLIAIIHTFSCRLNGLRKYKKNLKKH